MRGETRWYLCWRTSVMREPPVSWKSTLALFLFLGLTFGVPSLAVLTTLPGSEDRVRGTTAPWEAVFELGIYRWISLSEMDPPRDCGSPLSYVGSDSTVQVTVPFDRDAKVARDSIDPACYPILRMQWEEC